MCSRSPWRDRIVILAYQPKTAPVRVCERFQGFGLDAAQPVALLTIGAALVAFGLLRLVLHRQDRAD
jgi:molybdate/tungstate transport system permease protein